MNEANEGGHGRHNKTNQDNRMGCTNLDDAEVGVLLQALPQLLHAEALPDHHSFCRLVTHARNASPGHYTQGQAAGQCRTVDNTNKSRLKMKSTTTYLVC